MIKHREIFLLCILYHLIFAPLLPGQSSYSLQKALLAARTNNLEFRASKYNIELAEADLVSARLRPNLILNNQSLQLIQPAYFAPNTSWNEGRNRQVWWQVTKPFLFPGVRNSRINWANSNIELQQQVYNDQERKFLLEVSYSWINAWLSASHAGLLERQQSLTDSLRKKNLRDEQASNLKVEITARQLKLQLRSAQQLAEADRESLRIFLGLKEMIKIDTVIVSQLSLLNSLDSVQKNAILYRSDILYLNASIDAAKANIKMQKALALPGPELGVIYNPQNTVRYLGLFATIQIPIFSRNQGEIRKAGIIKQQTEDVLTYKVLQANAELYQATKNYMLQKANLKDYEELLNLTRSAVHESIKSPNLSTHSREEYIEALENYFKMQELYNESVAKFLKSAVELMFVNGNIGRLVPEN